ncbi:MAG: hypothetical protein J7623_06600 [Chitinophaga sp.]|uniref:hypothetical protein n=1 Tax=Chitinophaga sp. TaxID=1869181 RepID=UPI001B04A51E|nr:hypothetical protein [Chitinophaga sp.]MBO9728292.1 hypothetical protein [Chitinophaga sp.]
MKQKYYVNNNAQLNGDHEVHVNSCPYFSVMYSRIYLGEFNSCEEAVREAKKRFPRSNGCSTCNRPCHTT